MAGDSHRKGVIEEVTEPGNGGAGGTSATYRDSRHHVSISFQDRCVLHAGFSDPDVFEGPRNLR